MQFGKNIRTLFQNSVILRTLSRASDRTYRAIKNGFFGKLFTSYSAWNETFQHGALASGFGRLFARTEWKRSVAAHFESSRILRLLKAVCEALLCCRLKVYGAFLSSFGVYTEVVYLLKRYLSAGSADDSYFYTGIVLILLSVLFFLSGQTLIGALLQSRFAGFFLVQVMGVSRERYENVGHQNRKRYNTAIIWGMVLGAVTYVVAPVWYLVAVIVLLFGALTLYLPELGVITMFVVLPFLELVSHSSLWLVGVVLLTALSFLLKLIRGKRVVRFELIDVGMMLFMGTVFFGGTVSAGGSDSLRAALLCCALMLGYFLVVNLLRTEGWIRVALIGGVASAFLVSLYGCVQYFFTEMTPEWLDLSMFSDIAGRVTSVFDNPNYLAAYLTMLFPVALCLLLSEKRPKAKLLYLLIGLSMLVCLVLTFSRGAWLAVLFSVVMLLLIRSRRTPVGLLFALPLIPFVADLLPGHVVNRFVSIGNMADSSTFYRVYTWRGTLEMLKRYVFSGIGYGEGAFTQVYPVYAYAGIEGAMHSHSLLLQIVSDMGLVGLAVFAVTLFMASQNALEYIKTGEDAPSKAWIGALLCGVIGALVLGLTDYIWYNNKIFFLFWGLLGLLGACVRTGCTKDAMRTCGVDKNDEYRASLDIGPNQE